MPLAANAERPFDDVRFLGIAARSVDPIYDGQDFGLHVALLYKTDNQPARLAHLAWHHIQIADGAPDEAYKWDQIQLGDINTKTVASWLNKRRAKPDKIPYGFSVTGDVFERGTDEFIEPPLGMGLTCATYILAVLRHLGFPMLEEHTWPEARPDDLAWQVGILEKLQENGASAEHTTALAENVGAVRFRPDEVCGAAILPDWPIAFDDASTAAAEIVQFMGACRNAENGPAAT
ncbi:hypothetical protein HNR60_000890 [Rhodopseudomonas rhenobacensis]|uniref:Uncharacterized protein n=1 Tax=Rhodopseudomonas rhenobacensis TaxID=87461 RepID=A0A7W7Z175_9BRAD|nr:hypothetical protein [Rhodopseudomonas rhenobacensis]MBB5046148.1 hypothetical protein [Rhodopseudomonas rhenobacensis]